MSGIKNKPHSKKSYSICGAIAKSTGEPCQRPAGWGTDHPGVGKCKFHGGCSTGPPPEKMKGNKHAVTTGEHETIWLDTLDEKEQDLFQKIQTGVIEQLNNEIRLTDIRIRRMMLRISSLKEKDFTLVQKQKKKGVGPMGPVDMLEVKMEATLGQIQNIEDALTRVQSRKEKLLKLKHQIESGQIPGDIDISNYINALTGVAEEVWDDEEED